MDLLLGLTLLVPAVIIFLIFKEIISARGFPSVPESGQAIKNHQRGRQITWLSLSFGKSNRRLVNRLSTTVVIITLALVAFIGPSIYRKMNCNRWYENLDELELMASRESISGEGGKRAFLEVCSETGKPVQSALLLDIQLDATRASFAEDAASADQLEDVERRLHEAIRRQL